VEGDRGMVERWGRRGGGGKGAGEDDREGEDGV
jgi:hypothetical protein